MNFIYSFREHCRGRNPFFIFFVNFCFAGRCASSAIVLILPFSMLCALPLLGCCHLWSVTLIAVYGVVAVSFSMLCVDGELVCAEGYTQVTGVMVAMMMTGRVLLVCALCVLWCGIAGGGSAWSMENATLRKYYYGENSSFCKWFNYTYPDCKKQNEVSPPEATPEQSPAGADAGTKRVESEKLSDRHSAESLGKKSELIVLGDPGDADITQKLRITPERSGTEATTSHLPSTPAKTQQTLAEAPSPTMGNLQAPVQSGEAVKAGVMTQVKSVPQQKSPPQPQLTAQKNPTTTSNRLPKPETATASELTHSTLTGNATGSATPPAFDHNDATTTGENYEAKPQLPNGTLTSDTAVTHDENNTNKLTGIQGDAKTKTVTNAHKNDTVMPSDSDSSTVVSHTTSPLLLLLVVACAAAAAVVAV
ncbi:mucin-associated surface protein (MASP), putative [Trypanosoma cruzi marinkellei]|uniref:Mucin-associated surface protein (MASP), putative n=1 Tax=Trypanosoma cruzi marinkellei TaxID=85056 RepID=K2NEG1_TRYCR|nr:mucin-associated surface protein (MASP), putative [Trypanosoma cruzi marinkellei]